MSKHTKESLLELGADGLVNCECGCACKAEDIYECGADEFDTCEPGLLNDCSLCNDTWTEWAECEGPGDYAFCMRPLGTPRRSESTQEVSR